MYVALCYVVKIIKVILTGDSWLYTDGNFIATFKTSHLLLIKTTFMP